MIPLFPYLSQPRPTTSFLTRSADMKKDQSCNPFFLDVEMTKVIFSCSASVSFCYVLTWTKEKANWRQTLPGFGFLASF